MSNISFISVLILFVAYSSTNGQSAHYFDKYIEGIFKSIESPHAECLKLLEVSDESKMLANKDLVKCYTLIENEIPNQLKFDILSYRQKNKRAEEIKDTATFGTCYRKDSSSKYYAQLYTDFEAKPNKSLEENIYIANINSHCNNIYSAYLEIDNILMEVSPQIEKVMKTFFMMPLIYFAVTAGFVIYISITGVG